MLLATIGILFFGLFLIRPLLVVLRLPRTVLMPIVFVLCTVGSYSISQRLFDVWVMLAFGTLAFAMRRFGYPVAPFVPGIVLGDILDKSPRRALTLSEGDLTPFFTRPVSAVVALIAVFTFVSNIPSVRTLAGRAWRRSFSRTVAP